MKKYLPAIILALLSLSSCNDTEPDPIILSDGTPQISVRNTVRFIYDEASCQLGFNREKAEFRIQTDNTSGYVIVDLDRMPNAVGEKVTAESIQWTTYDDLEIRKNIVLEVLKLEDDNIWMWNARERIAVVVRILE